MCTQTHSQSPFSLGYGVKADGNEAANLVLEPFLSFYRPRVTHSLLNQQIPQANMYEIRERNFLIGHFGCSPINFHQHPNSKRISLKESFTVTVLTRFILLLAMAANTSESWIPVLHYFAKEKRALKYQEVSNAITLCTLLHQGEGNDLLDSL